MKYNNQIFLDEFKNKMLEINPQKVLFVCSNDYDRYGYRKALGEGKVGRPKAEVSDELREAVKRWRAGEITATEAMKISGTTRTTFYKLVKEGL